MSPGLGPRSSQWSALQQWSVNLPLSCLISPVWVSPGYLTPAVATADPLSLVRAPGPGPLWWQPGAVQEEGSQWVRLPRAPGAWRVRHYWNTKWMLGCQLGQQTSNTVPSHLSKLCTLYYQVPRGLSPAVTQQGPRGSVHLGLGQCPVSPSLGGSLQHSIHHSLPLFKCHNYQSWWQIHTKYCRNQQTEPLTINTESDPRSR